MPPFTLGVIPSWPTFPCASRAISPADPIRTLPSQTPSGRPNRSFSSFFSPCLDHLIRQQILVSASRDSARVVTSASGQNPEQCRALKAKIPFHL